MNCVSIINGANLVYNTNIGYFLPKFPVVEKYNDDNGVCEDSYTRYSKYHNSHSIKFLWIIFIGGGVGKLCNVLILLSILENYFYSLILTEKEQKVLTYS